MCNKAYGKVPIAWCDDLQLVRPQKNASGKEKRLRKENVTMWSIGHMEGLRRCDSELGSYPGQVMRCQGS